MLRFAVAALAAAVLAPTLGGCAALQDPQLGQEFMKHLEGCDRHYEGAIGAGVNGSFKIDCRSTSQTQVSPPA
jgi:hypothetical protein